MKRGRLRRFASRAAAEDGLTLVELLVAASMSVILLGAIGAMVVSAMRTQPKLTQKAQNVSSARWALERMTREIRNGVRVDKASASSVSFATYVRHASCGSTTLSTSSIKCEVTYTCSATACTRLEAKEGVYTGTAQTLLTGINSSSVFCFVPSAESDSLTCGTAKAAAETTYVGIKLRIPNSSSTGALTVSDGASLRNATLLK